jgi:threonyl-tRNA synthetase
MRILQLHSDFIEYEPIRKEITSAAEAEKKRVRLNDIVVLFTSVEKGDNEAVAKKAIEDVKAYLKKINLNHILIYPYAHLSSDLASPSDAMKILHVMEEYADELGIEAACAPFGWNKQFTISIKGHPLAEQARVYTAEALTGQVERIRPSPLKEYLILTPDGKVYDPKEYAYNPDETDFRILVEKEALGKESKAVGEPRYIRHMKKFGIDWETMSDLGHMHYCPEGTIMYEAIASYAQSIVASLPLPVYHIKGSNMFNLDLPPVREHAELFGDRCYQLNVEDKSFVMRYAACHQQFAVIRNWVISYRNLPFGAFEIADSYRLEQSGELLLSFRVRRMNMPDLHVFCRDIEEAKEWFLKLHEKIYEEIKNLGRDYWSLYNLTSREFFESNREWFNKLTRLEGKPVLLCFYPKGINYYWILNIEYHIIDAMQRPREIGTVQIDVGNARRFGIKYIDRNGEERYPIILHSAIIGTIERYMYALFDSAIKMTRPSLPTWVSPTQVRLIPVSAEHLAYAQTIAEILTQEEIRADVDDRDMSVSSKIREAEIMWVPYIAVVGDKEIEDTTVSVRIRAKKEQASFTISQFVGMIKKEIDGKPRIPSRLPTLMSSRPRFA